MPLLDEQIRNLLSEKFSSELKSRVRVVLFSESESLPQSGRRACLTCEDTEQLMKDVDDLSELIDLEIVETDKEPDLVAKWGVTFTPMIGLASDGEARVRFLGLPYGFEFESFVKTLTSLGIGPPFGLEADSVEKVATIGHPLDIKIFSTPT